VAYENAFKKHAHTILLCLTESCT